jgi:hypothetical protein
MRDLELWPSEKFVASDQFWLSVVRSIDPDVRRDMLGWFKCKYAEQTPAKREANAWRDYIVGAAQVINLFPTTPQISQSTAEAMQSDVRALNNDALIVNILVRNILEEYCKGVERTDRSKRPATSSE